MSLEMTKIPLLGEDDYLAAMRGPCREWRQQAVREGTFRAADGTHLQYYYAIPPEAKSNVVILHGLCGFFGKYHEMAWMLYQAGHAVFFMEHRGHGLSEGKLPEPDADLVYVDSYTTYVEDVWAFFRQVVGPNGEGRRMLLFGHSMGGAIATLFLERHPECFAAAILSSPMFHMRGAEYSMGMIRLYQAYAKLFHKAKAPAPGETHFSPEPVFEGGSAQSRARYDYLFAQRLEDRHYQTYGVTLGWALASLLAIRALLRDAGQIRIPVALMTAGQDHLVAPAGYDVFCAKVPQVERFFYAQARHELYNAEEASRRQYFHDLLAVLERFAGTPENAAGEPAP